MRCATPVAITANAILMIRTEYKMPHALKKPCAHPGCAALIPHDGRYCNPHDKFYKSAYTRERRTDPDFKKGDMFYSGTKWRKLRLWFLKRNPLCSCGADAAMVDHIQPIKQGGAKYEESNLQTMCNPCHSRKSAKEGSRWNPKF